jgi:hypothetical protein
MTNPTKVCPRDERQRIAEDREREQYVHAMMRQITAESGNWEFTRAAINSAWINGRNQILARDAAPAEAAQGERGALAQISLIERDTTSSDNEKVRAMARIARAALAPKAAQDGGGGNK